MEIVFTIVFLIFLQEFKIIIFFLDIFYINIVMILKKKLKMNLQNCHIEIMI